MGFEIRSLTSLVTIIYISIYPVESSLIMTIHNGIPLALAQIQICVIWKTLPIKIKVIVKSGWTKDADATTTNDNHLSTTVYRNKAQHSVAFS